MICPSVITTLTQILRSILIDHLLLSLTADTMEVILNETFKPYIRGKRKSNFPQPRPTRLCSRVKVSEPTEEDDTAAMETNISSRTFKRQEQVND